MSSVAKGWYVDPSTGTNLRWWDGTTWTDEVAPLPYEPTHSGPVDLFGAVADNALSTDGDAKTETKSSTESDDSTDQPVAVLDPEIELTKLTRRELRARRGTEVIADDCPKHLPPVTTVAAVSVAEWQEPIEELEIAALPLEPPVEHAAAHAKVDRARRHRIVRLSVLLGILAVASGVAALTAGTL